MVFAQIVIQKDANLFVPCPPVGTLLHPFSGKRVRMKIIQHEIIYLETPVSTSVPFRVDFTGFQSNALSFTTKPLSQSLDAIGAYPTIVSNSNGVGLIIPQYAGGVTAKVFSTPIVVEGRMLGNDLSAYLQLGSKLPGDYASVDVALTKIAYVMLYLDIEPID